MLPRLLTAILGALVITFALLLFMNRAANYFTERDMLQYFDIREFIPNEQRDARPRRPPDPQRPPPMPDIELDPAPRPLPSIEAPTVEPRLDPPGDDPEAAQ